MGRRTILRKPGDPDDAVLRANSSDHVVGDVARMIMQRPRRGVRGKDWSARSFEDLPEALVRYMRNVDDHAEAVDLLDRLPAQRRQTAVARLIGRRIRPSVRCKMGGRNRTDAVIPEFLQQFEAFLDRLRALN